MELSRTYIVYNTAKASDIILKIESLITIAATHSAIINPAITRFTSRIADITPDTDEPMILSY